MHCVCFVSQNEIFQNNVVWCRNLKWSNYRDQIIIFWGMCSQFYQSFRRIDTQYFKENFFSVKSTAASFEK